MGLPKKKKLRLKSQVSQRQARVVNLQKRKEMKAISTMVLFKKRKQLIIKIKTIKLITLMIKKVRKPKLVKYLNLSKKHLRSHLEANHPSEENRTSLVMISKRDLMDSNTMMEMTIRHLINKMLVLVGANLLICHHQLKLVTVTKTKKG